MACLPVRGDNPRVLASGLSNVQTGADPGFLERGFIFIKMWGLLCLHVLYHIFLIEPMKMV